MCLLRDSRYFLWVFDRQFAWDHSVIESAISEHIKRKNCDILSYSVRIGRTVNIIRAFTGLDGINNEALIAEIEVEL